VRILEMDVLGDPALLGAVIRRTNTQNPMRSLNLFAHDSAQLNVARYLDRYRVFYERREREWQNEKKALLPEYLHVTLKRVAQWLASLDDEIGLGQARSRVADLFNNYHENLFGNFDRALKSPAYDDLTLLVWSGLFVESVLRRLPKRTKAFAKISRLLLVKALYDAIRHSKPLRRSVPELLHDHAVGRRHIPGKILRQVKGIVAATVSLQKREQKRDPNVDYSNFFKRNDLTRSSS
jgi:hypothetical protein